MVHSLSTLKAFFLTSKGTFCKKKAFIFISYWCREMFVSESECINHPVKRNAAFCVLFPLRINTSNSTFASTIYTVCLGIRHRYNHQDIVSIAFKMSSILSFCFLLNILFYKHAEVWIFACVFLSLSCLLSASCVFTFLCCCMCVCQYVFVLALV